MPSASICTLGGGGNLSRSGDLEGGFVLECGTVGFAAVRETDAADSDAEVVENVGVKDNDSDDEGR